ncbi:MAG: hypothetical protein V2J25_10210 [Desulfatiglans sp.]|nr:hypothetical protein [Thermodesulfobacteriota bacterium]MEE4353232.1 hypothetical protein [Desulfatiglans sp.]
MRIWLSTVCVLFLLVTQVQGEDKEGDFVLMESQQIRASIRHMVQAGVPKEQALKMTRRMIQNRFREEQVIRVNAKIQKSAELGLPAEDLVDKVLEGTAKGVSAQSLVTALERVAARHALAAKESGLLVRERSRQRTLTRIMAQAFAAGVEEEDMLRLRNQLLLRARNLPDQEQEDLALETWRLTRELARLGVPSFDAAIMANHALRQRYNTIDMIRVRRSFLKDSMNTPPDILVGRYSVAIRAGADSEDLEKNGLSGIGGKQRPRSSSDPFGGGQGAGGSEGSGSGHGHGGGSRGR